MIWLQHVIDNFTQFFSWGALSGVLSDPVNWGIIGSLIILEGLLSADNAFVLAVMVKHLPKNQRRKALFYGILGAYCFRFTAVGLGTYLVNFILIKVLGAAYLLWIAYKGLFGGSGDDEMEGKRQTFWQTVIAVELMDIAFSINSVIAAFGVSDQIWVLFLGGILGVLMMRGVAQIFLNLINRFPELEKAAFILIVIIAVKMLAGAFGYHVSHIVFFLTLIVVFIGTIAISMFRSSKNTTGIENVTID